MYRETKTRSLFKAVSYRVVATCTVALLVFIFTRKVSTALFVGGLDFVIKLFCFFIHERFWDKVTFGKREIKPFVIWFTGLPGCQKSAIADLVFNEIKKNHRAERLNGSSVRRLFPELGFSRDEVNAHIKRIGHLVSILEKNGIIVVASFVSPYTAGRDSVKNNCNCYLEIYVRASVKRCREVYTQRHSKDAHALPFPEQLVESYEEPVNPLVTIDAEAMSLIEAKDRVMQSLKKIL